MSKQFHIRWDENAVYSLERIYHYAAATQSVQKAKKIKKGLVDTGYSLRTLPKRFPREELLETIPEEFRRAVYGNYKLIYLVLEDMVIIVDIFDTRQDPEKLIQKYG